MLVVVLRQRRRHRPRAWCRQLCRHLGVEVACAPALNFDDRAIRSASSSGDNAGASQARRAGRYVDTSARRLRARWRLTSPTLRFGRRRPRSTTLARPTRGGAGSYVDTSARRLRARPRLTPTTLRSARRPPRVTTSAPRLRARWRLTSTTPRFARRRPRVTTPSRRAPAVWAALPTCRHAGCVRARASLRRHRGPVGVVLARRRHRGACPRCGQPCRQPGAQVACALALNFDEAVAASRSSRCAHRRSGFAAGCRSPIDRSSCPRCAPPSAPPVPGPSRGVPTLAGAVDGAPAPPLSSPDDAHAGLVVAPARPVFMPCASRLVFSSSHSALCASPSVSAFARSSSHRNARARMTRAAFTSASFSCAHRPCASGVLAACSSRGAFSSSHSVLFASLSVSTLARSSSHRSARARMTRAAFTSASSSCARSAPARSSLGAHASAVVKLRSRSCKCSVVGDLSSSALGHFPHRW